MTIKRIGNTIRTVKLIIYDGANQLQGGYIDNIEYGEKRTLSRQDQDIKKNVH